MAKIDKLVVQVDDELLKMLLDKISNLESRVRKLEGTDQ